MCSATSAKTNLLGLDLNGMQRFVADQNEKPFRAKQLVKWIHQHYQDDFAEMLNLSQAFRDRLGDIAEIKAPEIVLDNQSHDGTRKWLLKLEALNGENSAAPNIVEMVFIPGNSRGTLCVSSQVGCTLDCSFCSTARQGFSRNLTSSEIVGQLWLAQQLLAQQNKKVTNVVMMGMGEPLHNFKAVVPAMQLMMEDNAYGLSRRRVTLSTAGVVPMIDELKAVSNVSLAVSLHAPNDALRDKLVPLNKKFPLRELLAACQRYVSDTEQKRHITFEYVMLEGVNDQPEQAKQLVQILENIPSKVNLIPFNDFPDSGYRRSPQKVIDNFASILQKAGLTTITRRTRGDDIDAACGQLAGKIHDRSQRHLKFQQPRFGSRPQN